MSCLTTSVQESWMLEAILEQEIYCSLLGDRDFDTFPSSDLRNLRRKIAFAMFEKPDSIEPNSKAEQRKLKKIHKICSMIKKEKGCQDGDYKISFTFVLYMWKDARNFAPVIRLPYGRGGCKFIDSSPRVYVSWKDYLKNNKLPKCVMCYPEGGVYREGCDFRFSRSPACRVVKDIAKGLYGTSVALGAGAGVVTTAAMFVPITLPVMAVAVATSVLSGACVAGLSISGLRDRDQHGQTLALRSSEARNHWFGLLAFLFESAAATTSVIRAATVLAKAKRTVGLAAHVAKVTAGTVKAIRMANFVATIVKRLGSKGITSTIDLLYLVETIYFFCNVSLSLEDVSIMVAFTNGEFGEFDIFEELFDYNDNLTQNEKQQILTILRILGRNTPKFYDIQHNY